MILGMGRGSGRRAGAAVLARFFVAGLLAGAVPGVAPLAAQDDVPHDRVPQVGLALSGGSAKGLAHIGVLRALERAGVHVDVVTGTSMGSVVGGLYATGMSPDSIESIIAAVDWSSLLGDRTERGRRFLHQRRVDERAILTLPVEGGGVEVPAGAVAGSNITRLAEVATWRVATVRSFVDLPRRFAAVATDIETGEAVTMTSGVLSEAMRASVGIPGALEPFELDGRLLVDGAVVRNLPAADARALGADILICSDVSDVLAGREALASLVDVLDQVLTLSMRPSTVAQRELCDILIRPDIEGISRLAFDRFEEWIARGDGAAERHADELLDVASRRGEATLPLPPDFLGDSVRVSAIGVNGSASPRAERLVRDELGIAPGDHITPGELAYRLGDLDATGLFGLVRYRLDRSGDAVALTVHVQERPKDRFGVGLRYDDEQRAALLFTTTLHNLLRYGSVTRLDLRVGEETRAAISYLMHRGVTGRLEGGTSLGWSQGRLRLPGSIRSEASVETTSLSTTLGLVAARTTFVGGELLGEWTISDHPGFADVLLLSASALVDHESLDRLDFPRAGVDLNGRWEWGVTDLVAGEGFSVLTARGHAYIPLHRRVTADFGGFVGIARGFDLPAHRNLFVGGAHRSAIFGRTQPTFNGLAPEELVGSVAQIGRAGIRWAATSSVYVRAGIDVGGVRDDWRFPVQNPVEGWAVSVGASTIVGPVVLEWSKASTRSDGRLSVSVGRTF